MLTPLEITWVGEGVTSAGNTRKEVDAYVVRYSAPPDNIVHETHCWSLRFEVQCGRPFVPRPFPTKAAALAACGYKQIKFQLDK